MFSVEWARALDPDFGLPTDIKFTVIKESNGYVHFEEGSISAHKYLLALVSPVFKELFFGRQRLTGNILTIRGTSVEAVSLMIDHIYQKKIDWLEKTVKIMVEVMALADDYGLKWLLEELHLYW